MSNPINPIQIMSYKIVREYEKTGNTVHTFDELLKFSLQVVNFANSLVKEKYWISQNNETNIKLKEYLSKFCDLTTTFCELNIQKYENGGKDFANGMIGLMDYSLLKGCITIYKEKQKTNDEKQI